MASRTSANIEVITLLRGLAALSVAWYHFTNSLPQLYNPVLHASGVYGWLGVPVFFVISGFVIPFSMNRAGYDDRRDKLTFMVKRLLRLEPSYFVAIAVAIVLAYLSSMVTGKDVAGPEITWQQVLLHIGYLNALVGLPWLNPMFWTLAVEFQFYISMIFLYRFVASSKPPVYLTTIVVLVAVSLALPYKSLVFPYYGEFSLGILAFHARRGQMPTWAFLPLCVAAALAVGFGLGVPSALASFAAALAIAYLNLTRTVFASYIGEISYAVYLMHGPIGGRVVNLGARFAHTGVAQVGVVLLALAVTIVASTLLYRLVERPAQRASSRIHYGERPGFLQVFSRNRGRGREADVPTRP